MPGGKAAKGAVRPARTSRPPRDPARNSADALMDAAGALMAERNSVDITFADIAERSGLNSALIQYRFGGKTGLFRALLERDAGAMLPALAALVAADLPAEEKLRRHIRGVIRTYHRHPYMNRLIGALASETDGDAARYISERFTRPIAAGHRAILRQGVAEGTFRPVDPMLFYFSLIGACDHLFHARYSLKWAFGIGEIDEPLSLAYAAHVEATVLASVLVALPTATVDRT